MRAPALFALLTAAFVAGYAPARDEAKQPTLAADSAALGALPKNGWVSAEKVPARVWLAAGGPSPYFLVARFEPAKDAKPGEARGKVLLGFDLSKDGQAEAILAPAYGTYELHDTKAGRVIRVTQTNVPDQAAPLEKKRDKVSFDLPYRLKDGALTFPKGIDTDYWSSTPASVKHKAAVSFRAK